MSSNTYICSCCGIPFDRVISIKDKLKNMSGNFYCSKSCAAKISNTLFPRRKLINKCALCKNPILSIRKFCSKCYSKSGRPHPSIDLVESRYKLCTSCNLILAIDNFLAKNKKNMYARGICRACLKIKSIQSKKNNKQKAINYLGGKCADCKNIFPIEVYDFHHNYPESKDFVISSKLTSKFENLKKELDKCTLLCSNCHRLRHCG